ncbi:MAG: DnaB-like helicase N-terminal domain-containing protein [Oscillospiraceae bacterium]
MAGLTAAPVGRLEAENAVLGSLLLDERLAASILAAVDLADIADPANRRIFQAARALLRDGLPVDPVTIRGKLGKDSEARLVQLLEVTPTAANWREYADIMHEQAALSRIRDIAQELADAQTVDDCRGRIASLGEILAGGEGVDAWTMADAYRYFMAAQSDEHKREYIELRHARDRRGHIHRAGRRRRDRRRALQRQDSLCAQVGLSHGAAAQRGLF